MQCVYVMNRSIKKNIHRLGTKKSQYGTVLRIWIMLMLIWINKFGMMWDLDHADVDPDQQIRDDAGFGSC